ncbi:MAG: hypothetical protein KGI91_16945 [Burkholderiales bacterium]|nr:hypothetical protein [Burkholderiales bacterium]
MNLFSRYCWANGTWRKRARAHIILDEWKAGVDYAPEVIDWALRITGDLT